MAGLGAGRLDKLVQFLGRPTFDPTTTARAGFVPLGAPVWAFFKPSNAVRLYFGNFRVYVPSGALTVRNEPLQRTITAAHQAVIDGRSFQVRSSAPPDRRTGDIVMDVVGAQDQGAYQREIDTNGEVVTVVRGGISANARAQIDGYQPNELTGDMQQGDRRVMLLASDLDATSFPQPIQTNDEIIVRDVTLNVQAVDDNTHRVGGQLLAYQINARG